MLGFHLWDTYVKNPTSKLNSTFRTFSGICLRPFISPLQQCSTRCRRRCTRSRRRTAELRNCDFPDRWRSRIRNIWSGRVPNPSPEAKLIFPSRSEEAATIMNHNYFKSFLIIPNFSTVYIAAGRGYYWGSFLASHLGLNHSAGYLVNNVNRAERKTVIFKAPYPPKQPPAQAFAARLKWG